MTRILSTSLLLLALTFAVAGCDEPLTANQMADAATQELGTVIMLWGTSDDVCLTRQVRSLYDEYSHSTPAQKQALRQALQKYSAVIINASESVGTIHRSVDRLELNATVCHMDSLCADEVIDTRTVLKTPWGSSSGKFPGTRVEKGDQLVLTPVSAQDTSVTTTYSTYDRGVYLGAGTADYADLKTLLKYRAINLVSEQKADPVNCGKLVRIEDLK